jgi:hypothetical protein
VTRTSNEGAVADAEAGVAEDGERRVVSGTDERPASPEADERSSSLEDALESLFSGASGSPSESNPTSEIDTDERVALGAARIEPAAVADKEYSYRMLLQEGVDEAVAATLRRRFSLPWSFESDGDLERRSSEVRGLGAAEREWIAKSGDDWQAFEYDHAMELPTADDGPDERPWPKPTPITDVTGVSADAADALADAGIVSAERLATVDAARVASLLEFDVLHVRTWRYNARELVE